jgi:energy-coupling factor transporter transmembrane protein EcfT
MFRSPRRLLRLLWLLGFALWIFLVLFPISTKITRLAGIIALVLVIAALLALSWRIRLLRLALLVVILLFAVLTLLPGRAPNASLLRLDCARAMQRYEGARYIWGGESFKGIDCSGLVRRGIVDSCFIDGLRMVNPRLLRIGYSIWWHDCTAKDLRDQYLEMTRPIAEATAINAAHESDLQPGDLAVTANGIHILAYLGNNSWIEADPSVGKVIQVKMPSTNPWFNTPVKFMRWRILD